MTGLNVIKHPNSSIILPHNYFSKHMFFIFFKQVPHAAAWLLCYMRDAYMYLIQPNQKFKASRFYQATQLGTTISNLYFNFSYFLFETPQATTWHAIPYSVQLAKLSLQLKKYKHLLCRREFSRYIQQYRIENLTKPISLTIFCELFSFCII